MITARAPSNIALIKYMGKEDASLNLPANPSLSLTLSSLCTVAEIRAATGASNWVPELPESVKTDARFTVPDLSPSGAERILRHVARFGSAPVELRTANSFPMAAGIASSASSFAAVTRAAAEFFGIAKSAEDLAQLSRQGSGSSCRSFFGPWVKWDGVSVSPVPSVLPELTDLVVIVRAEQKSIGSTEAHRRVMTSPLWQGRPERARARAQLLESSLALGDLRTIAMLSWEEAWEMHSLFHTSTPPFTYWAPQTLEILQWFTPQIGDASPPIVTLDAGPNVHVLVPTHRAQEWHEEILKKFPDVKILMDTQGSGA